MDDDETRRFDGLLDKEGAALVDEFEDDSYHGTANLERAEDGFAVHGRVASRNSLLILTLNFADPTVLEEAKRIVRSAAIVDPPNAKDLRD